MGAALGPVSPGFQPLTQQGKLKVRIMVQNSSGELGSLRALYAYCSAPARLTGVPRWGALFPVPRKGTAE